MRCPRPDCAGSIDDTGYCDSCFRPSRAETRPPVLPGRTPGAGPTPEECACDSSVPTGGFDVAAGLVELPVLETPDPTSRLMDDQSLISSRRRCGKNGCAGEIGGSFAGQPSLLEGVCGRCGTPFSFRPKLRAGRLVAGQYEVMGPLAQSGFGWVYLARDRHLDGNYVVLKGLINANDSRAAEMAVRERQYLTRLNHPNIVRIYNAVTHTDEGSGEHTGYIVMEYLDGPSLEEVRRTARVCRCGRARLPLDHILGIGHEILSALTYLHGQGLLYCDMKPANVMRSSDRITVIDLGGMSEIAAADRAPVGTAFYQAPEAEIRATGATVKSDVYTVGRTLEMLYADAGATAEDVPAESFVRLIRRATDTDHRRRFATATEMSEQLTGVLRELLAVRDRAEHAASSTLFAPTAEVIDGGFGAVPPLDRWTATALPSRPGDPPPHRSVALGLPIPRTDPADPGARFLGGGVRHDPHDLLARLEQGTSAELMLRGCRAYIELGDITSAKTCIADAEGILRGTPGEWRLSWYLGLLAFAGADLTAATREFTSVCDFWPGEVAPKLALALCAERTGDATSFFEVVWLRDRSQTSAAFGLARLRLAEGDRAGAAAVLDEVPLMSPHRDAARIAAVRAFADPLPALPSRSDVDRAARRLPGLRLDGGAPDGEARRRMTALVRQAGDADPAALERSYRELAGQARSARDHEILIDLANRVRPRTLLTWWR